MNVCMQTVNTFKTWNLAKWYILHIGKSRGYNANPFNSELAMQTYQVSMCTTISANPLVYYLNMLTCHPNCNLLCLITNCCVNIAVHVSLTSSWLQ
jgi:hypothetical protein